jgi:hypothetical protein
MTDKFGIQLNIGDTVIFTTGGQGTVYLELGTIREINGDHAKIYSHDSKRVLTNTRYSSSLVSAMPIYAQHPELAI